LALGFAMSFGEGFVFGIYGIVGILLGVYALTQDRVAPERLSTFVSVPLTSGPVASEMDPRQEE
jgi:hypothetical protein